MAPMTNTMAQAPSTPVLIDAGALAAALAAGRQIVLLDVRWAAGRVQRSDYLQGHLPGAVFLDLDADLAAPPGRLGRHPLPDPAVLQDVWRSAGIDDDSVVVVYDAKDSSVAARAWWLLRWSGVGDVRVLDGGFAGWVVDPARPVERGEPAPRAAGRMTVRPGGLPVVDTAGATALATGSGVLLDARAPARYRGETEPLDPVAGHIPGARNLPLTDLLMPDGTFRPAAELAALLDRAVGTADEVAASCGSGVTACHLILAAASVGRSIALYPDSYSGWLAQGLPIATGPDPDAGLT
jgi:thiosulfate/3-mercaptopyruvate sulfurtransferase